MLGLVGEGGQGRALAVHGAEFVFQRFDAMTLGLGLALGFGIADAGGDAADDNAPAETQDSEQEQRQVGVVRQREEAYIHHLAIVYRKGEEQQCNGNNADGLEATLKCTEHLSCVSYASLPAAC